jgi:hypothetical protein
MYIDPWAKLITRRTPKTRESPEAIMKRSIPWLRPLIIMKTNSCQVIVFVHLMNQGQRKIGKEGPAGI